MSEAQTIFYSADQPRLLLVEDDCVAREQIEKFGATNDYEITYVSELAKALGLLDRKRFQIILLDLNLPDSEGADTFDAVMAKAGGTPIIVFTGIDDQGLARELTGRGAHNYLVKSKSNPASIGRSIELALAHRQTQKALSKEQALLGALMDNLPDKIYFKDLQSRFIRINRDLARHIKIESPAEAEGKTDFDFFTAEHAQPAFDDEQNIIRNGQPKIGIVEKETHPDGRVTWVSSSKMPLRDAMGKIIGTFGLSRDITELIQKEEQLQDANRKVEAANKAKSEFLANMSHEIRTPMNGIIGITELLLKSQLSTPQLDYMNMINRSADQLMRLLNDILDFSKIEAGKLDLEIIPFELRDSLADTLKIMAGRAAEKNLELAYHIPPGIPDHLMGDPGRLCQIIVNLVGNAIKFTELGEVLVDVSLKSQDDDDVRLHFQVVDTGIGIPQEKCDTIFEAFNQADATTTRSFGGTGLGLAITASLVSMMDGQIWVESEVGKGSSFQFTAVFGLRKDAKSFDFKSPPTLRGLPVLVVDDNDTNCMILDEMLRSWEMAPTVVEGGEEALKALDRSLIDGAPFRLAILDAMMPGMDGFELAERIRKRPEWDRLIMVLLSSAAFQDQHKRALRVGFARSMCKPIKQSDLFNAITRLTGTVALDSNGHATEFDEWGEVIPLRILLAEDGLVNQRVAKDLLSQRGHIVVIAVNGKEAAEAHLREEFDLILMDIHMPIMDGFEATAAIREQEHATGARIPIIALTANAMKGDRERCLAGGMDGYLSKPIRAHDLYRVVEQSGGAAQLSKGDRPRLLADSTAAVRMEIEEKPVPAVRGSDPGDEPIIDPEVAMAHVEGNEDLIKEMVGIFFEESGDMISKIESGIETGDAKLVERAAHTLKSSSAMFGAKRARTAAFELELAGQSGDISGAPQLFDRLQQEIELLRCAVNDKWGTNAK
jgi:two-component system, sensor histidine kinase and response regulator